MSEPLFMSASVTIGQPGQFAEFERYARERFEQAALRASSRAARSAAIEIRRALPGRLGGAIGAGGDLQKRGRAFPLANGFSASGWIYIRGKSPRTLGALESMTRGAEIVPKKGAWLAIATDEIPKRAGRYKMTPQLYRQTGLEARIGPLVFVPGRSSGEALLVVKGPLTVDRFGRPGRARRLPKRGGLRASRRVVQEVVAFVLIRATSRAARVDPAAIIAAHAARLPALLSEELRKEISNG